MNDKSAKRKKWIAEHPAEYEVIRKRAKLKWTYGITLEEFNALLKKQSNKCAICGTRKPGGNGKLQVDHNHKTGKVRGLLCVVCNQGLGYFRDNIDLIRSAVKYLRRFK